MVNMLGVGGGRGPGGSCLVGFHFVIGWSEKADYIYIYIRESRRL